MYIRAYNHVCGHAGMCACMHANVRTCSRALVCVCSNMIVCLPAYLRISLPVGVCTLMAHIQSHICAYTQDHLRTRQQRATNFKHVLTCYQDYVCPHMHARTHIDMQHMKVHRKTMGITHKYAQKHAQVNACACIRLHINTNP